VQLRVVHDQEPIGKRTAAWEAFVGSFTSSEPNMAERSEEILRAELGRNEGRTASGHRFGPAGTPAPYQAAEEVFNKLTGDDGLGALEVTRPTNAPARYHLSIKQTLRM
jgi:hypothetical protein